MPEVPCEAFKKNPDGSWTCIKPVSIVGEMGQVQINPGMSFSPGVQFMGLNLAELLDKNCT